MSSKSLELKSFVEKAKLIFGEYLSRLDFQETESSTENYFCSLIYKNDDRYVKISGSIHPRDYPPYYNLILGKGKTSWPDTDWNSVALWKIKEHLHPDKKAKEYSFINPDKIEFSLNHAKKELDLYGKEFLNNKLELFEKVRSKVNSEREPYKIYEPTKKGGFKIFIDRISQKLKEKFS